MILADALSREALEFCWPLLVGRASESGKPQTTMLEDGVELKCELAFGIMFARIAVTGRQFTDAEDQAFVESCGIPSDARRVPLRGVARVAMLHGGMTGAQIDVISYRWMYSQGT